MSTEWTRSTLAIIGAGPTGLDAALAAAAAGIDFVLYEAASRPGGNVRAWGHIRLFTPWPMNVSPRARAALAGAGIEVPDGARCPTGHELAERLLDPLASLPSIAHRVRYGARVVEIGRDGLLKSDEIGTGRRAERSFRMLVEAPDGRQSVAYADVVLDCTGTYGTPNALGAGGIAAPGEGAVEDAIIRRIPDLEAPDFTGDAPDWAGQRILLVGAGHSAQTVARDLADFVERAPGTTVAWAIRNPDPTFGAMAEDPLPERAALVERAAALARGAESPFDVRLGSTVDALAPSDAGIVVTLRSTDGSTDEIVVDLIVAMTGSVGEARMYRQLQVHECYATAGPMKLAAALLSSSSTDCLTEQSHGADTLRNPEPNFYILGEKSYGRNSNFLMRVGWDQVEDVFGLLAQSGVTGVVNETDDETGRVAGGPGPSPERVTSPGGVQ